MSIAYFEFEKEAQEADRALANFDELVLRHLKFTEDEAREIVESIRRDLIAARDEYRRCAKLLRTDADPGTALRMCRATCSNTSR